MQIGERNLYRPESLHAAGKWIEQEFQRRGMSRVRRLPVTADKEEFSLPVNNNVSFNVEAEILGTGPDLLIIGAHYDSKVAMDDWHGHWPPKTDTPGTPGANDNASGVAALLWLAEAFRNGSHERTLRFVAFTNEEPPFFQTSAMGSVEYAKTLRQEAFRDIKMISLETIGCYTPRPNRKRIRLVSLFGVSDSVDYVAFLGNIGSRGWMEDQAEVFAKHSRISARTLALPEVAKRVAWSDDWSFWQQGIQAFSVTDTAYLRSDDYHETTDTAEQLDYDVMSEVVLALQMMIQESASKTEN